MFKLRGNNSTWLLLLLLLLLVVSFGLVIEFIVKALLPLERDNEDDTNVGVAVAVEWIGGSTAVVRSLPPLWSGANANAKSTLNTTTLICFIAIQPDASNKMVVTRESKEIVMMTVVVVVVLGTVPVEWCY